MKKYFARVMSALLVICLSLAVSPVAFMEETIEQQITTEEEEKEKLTDIVEEKRTDSIEAPDVPKEDEEELHDDEMEIVEENIDEEILPEAVDEVVDENVSDLPIYEVQDDGIVVQEDALAESIVTGDSLSSETASLSLNMEADSNRIYVNETNFPDEDFREYVKKFAIKHNDSYYFIKGEITKATSMHIPVTVKNATGIQYFTYLQELTCSIGGQLTELDVSGLKELKTIQCTNSSLKSLSVRNCTSLVELKCFGNKQMTSLDVKGCSKLEAINCHDCPLQTLDVGDCISLKSLSCGGTQLTTLDLKNCTKLEMLGCYPNLKLSTLDVSGCKQLINVDIEKCNVKVLNLKNCYKLERIHCGSNQMEKLYIEGCKNLSELNCFNNELKRLDATNCVNLKTLNCSGNSLTTLIVKGCESLESITCHINKLTSLKITDCPRIMGYVTANYYNLSADKKTVTYSNNEVVYLRCDSNVNITGGIPVAPLLTPTSQSKATPEPEAASEPTATLALAHNPAPTPVPMQQIPTISAVKKNSKAVVSAAPGSVYQLDLGGASGKGFKSSKKKVAVVDGNGNVTIRGAGKTKITFKVGKKKRTVTLTVKDPTIPAGVALNPVNTAVKVGESVALTPVIPDGTASGFKWKSSNKKVARVSNGVVTFKKPGKVTITCTCVRGKKKAKVTFKVSK